MHRWLLINEDIVMHVIESEDMPTNNDYNFDTIAEDPDNFFKVGDTYSIEKYTEFLDSKLSDDEKLHNWRKATTVEKRQIVLACILESLKEEVDEAISKSTPGTRYIWYTADDKTPISRLCSGVKEVIAYSTITEEQMDNLFKVAIGINSQDLSLALTDSQMQKLGEYLDSKS